MKIYGIGTDIVSIIRIKKLCTKKNFLKRLFGKEEVVRCSKLTNPHNCFAKRYAAKEACAKALGTGLARGVFWKDIEIQNDKFGKPKIKLHNNALKFLKKMIKSNDCSIEVSLSDEKKYAIANVIIYGKEKR